MATFGSKKSLTLLIILALALVAVVFGLRHQQAKRSVAVVRPPVVTHSTDTPDETAPDKSYKWVGYGTDPKYIRLPSIGAEGYVQRVGVDQNKQMAVPDNIHIAGWFVDSQPLSKPGLSIIDGHVDGHRAAGIFVSLSKLKANDQFSIELGSGKRLTYKVMQVRSVKTDVAADTLYSQDPHIASQLNLITCGGTFNSQAGGYDQRVIVIAAQV